MSLAHPTRVFDSLRTRQVILQNPTGSFQQYGSTLAVADSRGTVRPTRDLSLNSITIQSPNLEIDASGNIYAKLIELTAGAGVAVETGTGTGTGGNVVATNANILITGNQNQTGYCESSTLVLRDLSSIAVPYSSLVGYEGDLLFVQGQSQDRDIRGSTHINISQGIANLAVEPSASDIVLATGPSDTTGMFINLMTILNIFNSRGIFIQLAS